MNIHEYQGKSILQSHGVQVQEGFVAETAAQAKMVAEELHKKYGPGIFVIKAQIHAGGRGKGGGVKIAASPEEVADVASRMLGMTLVTPQTGPAGKVVHKVLVARDVYYKGESDTKEFYLSLLLDRRKSAYVVVYSTEGGIDIEEVAARSPEAIFTEVVDSSCCLHEFQMRTIASNLGLHGKAYREMTNFIRGLWESFVNSDASLIEINPLLKTSDDKVLAVDCKVTIDDNALYRHPELEAMRDLDEEDPIEVEAGASNLNYVKLDGDVGCMVNGAGLAMATMDLIQLSGGKPANFLDVGGGANAKTVEAGFRIILKDPNVKAILVNIFGGIVRCDRVAGGIIEAYKTIGDISVPVIVRLQGTNAVEAKELIDLSGLKVIAASTFNDAAEKVRAALS
ncbi:MAG: ADP-forming succinate--CoA ligase subunit beta [Bacteroidales bacterium]|jgi:succinyl-CoA synthetase beta subunit|nr:ADP-forming succinate--CoA ligase subunit beta [Bacteroidales bacterium]